MRVEVLGSEPMSWPGYGITLEPGINEIDEPPFGLKRSFERHRDAGALRFIEEPTEEVSAPTSPKSSPKQHQKRR